MSIIREIKIGQLTIQIPPLSIIEKRLGSPPKFYIEGDFKSRIPKYPTNEKLRDHLDKKINAYIDILYLDANKERLKIWSTSYKSMLRVAVYLNSLMNNVISIKEIEEIRKQQLSEYETNHNEETQDSNNHSSLLMAGLLDFRIQFKMNVFDGFIVSGNFIKLYSDCADHEDIEEELTYSLLDSPHFHDIELNLDTDIFVAYAKTKEALVDLMVDMNKLADVHFTDKDKTLLLTEINKFAYLNSF